MMMRNFVEDVLAVMTLFSPLCGYMAQHSLNMAPKWPQHGSNMAQQSAKMAQNWAEHGSKSCVCWLQSP
jgi:hypothetical protein